MAEATLPTTSVRTRTWPIWSLVATWCVAATLGPVLLAVAAGRPPSVHFLATAFFFAINAMIAYWELALFKHADDIRDEYEAAREGARGRELAHIFSFFTRRVTGSEACTLRPWASVWAAYAVIDPAYADKRSFGFAIDIGNGFTTLLPSLAVPALIALGWGSPRVMGIVVLIFSWQMFYGTVLYFVSFVINRRYVGHRLRDVAVFVGLSNLMWTIFPLWTGLLGVSMILENGYAAFTG